MVSFSAVLIVKNEAATLARCLKSLAGVDHVVVHDTGSTDDTVKIARSMGADVSATKIEPFHFAKARNEALERAKHKWVLSIDADETLGDGSFGQILEGIRNPIAAGYLVNYDNRSQPGGGVVKSRRMLLFKRGAWSWRYRIHERLTPTYPPAKVGYLPRCWVEHHPVGDKTVRRAQNLELLRLSLEEDPGHFYASRQLGLEYVLLGRWAEAIPHLEAYLTSEGGIAAPSVERASSRMHLAKCLARSGELRRAILQFEGAVLEAPERREPFYWAAIELLMVARPWEAIPWLERCLQVPPSEDPSFSLHSPELQKTLAQETLDDCRKMIEDAKARLGEGK